MDAVFESIAERRIREAIERGEFDDLPGAGRPLPDTGKPYDEMWWVEAWLKRNVLDGGELAEAVRRSQGPQDCSDPER